MKWNIILIISEFSFSIKVENVEDKERLEIQKLFKNYFDYCTFKGWGAGIDNDCLSFSGSHKDFSYMGLLENINKILYK